jgi:effector-binding domain-containing protein
MVRLAAMSSGPAADTGVLSRDCAHGDGLVRSAHVAYQVHAYRAEQRPLAAIRGTSNRQRLSQDIGRLLELVWPVLREQRVRTGHKVVVYYPGDGGRIPIDVGVETFTEFASCGEVRHAATPAGEVATVAHYGEYSAMAPAYAALEQWCADNGRRSAGVAWAVCGDWEDDPSKRRTDLHMLLEPPAA